jgi:four helix bundle protein
VTFVHHIQLGDSPVEERWELKMPSSFRDLRVWKEAMTLTMDIYRSTSKFPKDEIYGLTQQMRRAAVSVPSNIAEGKGHFSDKEFCRFLFHARGSLQELQTQIPIAERLQYLSGGDALRLTQTAEGVGRALSGLITSLRDRVV